MKIVIVRHAEAEEAIPDAGRKLTKRGKKEFRRSAKALVRMAGPLDRIYTSPLVRAQETADLLARAQPRIRVREEEQLSPGGRLQALKRWIERQKGTIAVVGHEPQLGALAAMLIGARAGASVKLNKGGACLIEIDGRGRDGKLKARMRWLLTGDQLSRL